MYIIKKFLSIAPYTESYKYLPAVDKNKLGTLILLSSITLSSFAHLLFIAIEDTKADAENTLKYPFREAIRLLLKAIIFPEAVFN